MLVRMKKAELTHQSPVKQVVQYIDVHSEGSFYSRSIRNLKGHERGCQPIARETGTIIWQGGSTEFGNGDSVYLTVSFQQS